MNSNPLKPTLFFYVDKEHFPSKIPSSVNDPVVKNIDNRNTWYAWTIKTFLYLKDVFHCELTLKLPSRGIIFYFRGSINLSFKPSPQQFLICMVGDATWHPYANINVFQNFYQSKIFKNGFFMQHWLLEDIIPNDKPFQNPIPTISYFGDFVNLDPYFKSDEWLEDLSDLGFKWVEKPNHEWNNYQNVDIIIAVRRFNSNINFIQRPASKLLNAWHGHVIPIMGKECAYQAYKTSADDYLEVDSIAELKDVLKNLKTNPLLVKNILDNGTRRSKEITNDVIKMEWVNFINQVVYPRADKWFRKGVVMKMLFVVRGFIYYRSNALVNRFFPNVWLSKK